MRRVLPIFAFLLLFVIGAKAQNYKVLSMEHVTGDMTAREEMRMDDDERKCAVIKIVTQNITPEARSGFYFQSDWGSQVVHRDIKGGVIRVWVSPGLKTLIIMHEDLGTWELKLPDYGLTVEPMHTYKVVVQGTMVANSIEVKPVTTQQYLAFQITPPNAVLEVNGELWTLDAEGTTMKYVDFGSYSYRVRASDYITEEHTVTVNNPDSTKIVQVSLKPNFAVVTLAVDADAEIWVNNEKKGVKTWTGSLGKGTYKIECKQAGHETAAISKAITPEMNGQTITLQAPKPIYGSLQIESTPNFCKLYVDGKDYGTTPKSINEILVGRHEVKLTKDGYDDYIETVTIDKGERKQVKATVKKQELKQETEPQPVVATSTSLSVKSFVLLPMDMTANSLGGKRLDQNDNVAALIKIVTPETGFWFEGGTLGIVDSRQEKGEIWVWVPRGLRKITIKHQKYGILRDYRFPVEIESGRTYEMVLLVPSGDKTTSISGCDVNKLNDEIKAMTTKLNNLVNDWSLASNIDVKNEKKNLYNGLISQFDAKLNSLPKDCKSKLDSKLLKNYEFVKKLIK